MSQTALAIEAPAIATLQRACDCNDSGASCREEEAIQPKLTIGAPGDTYEQEADRVADRIVSSPLPAASAPIATTPFVQRQEEPVQPMEEEDEEFVQAKAQSLQRMKEDEEEGLQMKSETVRRMEGDEEESLQTKPETIRRMEGEEEEEIIQAKASPVTRPATLAPTAATRAGETVRSGGTPLSPAERAFFEPRFGHDLSHVRLHTDASAAQAARGINARAYTLRDHIAFAPGQYSSDTTEGQRLMAHELTHTLQQSPTSQSVQKRSFIDEIAGLFRGDNFGDEELVAYLGHLVDRQSIEDFTDSDNKARAVTRRLMQGEDLFGYEDTGVLRVLLIKEMLSGFTGNEDEGAILSLLGSASLTQLGEMFGAGGLRPEILDDRFQGAEQSGLDRFFDTRFRGGREAMATGMIEPIHRPRSPGPFSIERARARLREVEHLLAEALEIERERDRYATLRRMMDEQSSDAAAALGIKAREEERRSSGMNRQPLEIRLNGPRIEFHVRFHVRFEDPAMAGRMSELRSNLADGIAQVWNTNFDEGALDDRRFVMIPEITEVASGAARDHRFWLVSVRPSDTSPAAYEGCEIPDLVEGVPTSATDTLCNGGLISIPPSHIDRASTLGHETLHLFGLVDRYVALTSMNEDGSEVTGHENAPTRSTGGRADPLGTEDGAILGEDLSFVLQRQGVYDREIARRTNSQSVVSLTIEANNLREAIRLGRDPNSLIRPRENFNDEIIRSAEDI